MIMVEQMGEMPTMNDAGECIIPDGIRSLFIDENDVNEIRFPFNHCGVMQLAQGRSGHFAAALVDTSCNTPVVLDETVLGRILLSGEWTCNHGPRGSMKLIRQADQPTKSFWRSFLEARYMNTSPSQQNTVSWADVSQKLSNPPVTVNNLRTYFYRKINL